MQFILLCAAYLALRVPKIFLVGILTIQIDLTKSVSTNKSMITFPVAPTAVVTELMIEPLLDEQPKEPREGMA